MVHHAPRGDSPQGVAPSSYGPAWSYVRCPNCEERIKEPFARLPGVAVHVHRYHREQDYMCRVVVVTLADGTFTARALPQETSLEEAIEQAMRELAA